MCGGVIVDRGVGWVGVIGVAELLLKTTLTEEQREYLNIIRVSGDNLLRIISDILDLSKIETHKLVLERAQFGVRELLTESLSLLQVIAQEKGIKVLDRPHHRDVDVNGSERYFLLALTIARVTHFQNVASIKWSFWKKRPTLICNSVMTSI